MTVAQKRPWQSAFMKSLPMDKHPRWKGDNAGYRAIHYRIVKLYGKADMCENQICTHDGYHRFEWANLGEYTNLDRSNWLKLCVFCHRQLDKQGIKPVYEL